MHRVLTAIFFSVVSAAALGLTLDGSMADASMAGSGGLTAIAGQEKQEKSDVVTPARSMNGADLEGASAETQQGESRPDDHASDAIVVAPDWSPDSQLSSSPDAVDPAAADKEYLVETATNGGTMARQGPELAIGRLHPEFANRLAGAIREARETGLPSAGISSAYRPPAFGVGGFSDKFNSLHTYGLAVDMTGIGGPGSEQAKLWYDIAAKHGVVCPYGSKNRVEWNHCQPTRLKIIAPQSPLRETVTAAGPLDLQHMFEAGSAVIESEADANDFMSTGTLDQKALPHDEVTGKRSSEHTAATESYKVHLDPGLIKIEPRGEQHRLARSGPPTWCSHLHRPRPDTCGGSHEIEISKKQQNPHPRQASTASSRESRKL